MRFTEPSFHVVSRPLLDWAAIKDYLDEVGGIGWLDRVPALPTERLSDAEYLVEVGGRLCYRSWDVGLNPNVTKVRTDSAEYLNNILAQRHGSVLAHAHYSFICHNVSRVLTHELVRHVAGTDFSQESLRYVRLTDIPMWIPAWAREDVELMRHICDWLAATEDLQEWMTRHFGLAQLPFHRKKMLTSFMRRFAPMGLTTDIMMTANVRELRWIIEMRSDPSAEEEIRLFADALARAMIEECPVLFGDFAVSGMHWVPGHSKV